jgi:3-hydroxyisobutyrate dehydrogenase
MANVAFIGTGMLGSGIVEGLLRRGDAVTVWNRTASKAKALEALGATVAPTPQDAVAGAAEVHIIVSDDAAVDGLLEQIVPRLGPGVPVIDHTTTSPRGTAARLARMAERGVPFLHAPVFMSPPMARDALGMVLVSGPQPVFDRMRSRLEQMASEVWYVGEEGHLAAAYKIFGNSMLFVITAGVSDVFAMGKALGIEPSDALAVFSKFQPGNLIAGRGAKMARGDFSATFELTMARKDMRLMLEAAGDEPLVVLPAVAKRMDDAIASGHGQDDLGAIAAQVIQ